MQKIPMIVWACGVCVPGVSQGLVRPTWIEVLPQQPGKVFAVGAASLGENPAASLKQASQNARLELATRLRASVRGETTLKSQMTVQRDLTGTTADSRQQVAQDSRTSTQIAEITGLAIAEHWTDSAGGTVYALACLDVDAAMGSLRGRADAVRSGLTRLGGPLTDPRGAAQAVLSVRKGREEAARLEELSAPLIGAGGDPDFRARIAKLQSDLAAKADELRGSLTLGVEGASSLQPELVAVLRAAAQQQGFGWVDGRGLLTLRVKTKSPSRIWWSEDDASDFITHKGTLQVSLVDREGHPRGTASLEATGVGTSAAGASQGLMKDLRRKFDGTLDRWLGDLAL